MKVLYDHLIFEEQKFGGASRYFYEITQRLGDDVQPIGSVLLSNNIYIQNSSIFSAKSFFPNYNFRGKVSLMNYLNTRHTLNQIKLNKFDILHITNYSDYFNKQIKNKPFVLTVHDMIHEKYKEMLQDYTTIELKRNLVNSASRIIAVSKQTKFDLIDVLNVPDSKIDVIYHGSSLGKFEGERIDKNYILFVGARGYYKNFQNFVKAFANISVKYADLDIICTGLEFNKSEWQLLHELGLSKRISAIPANEKKLAQLYRNATFFIYPSFYEGFGIPILEAYENDCPVLLSDRSCFPEIADNAGIYFDPQSIDSIMNAMTLILDDSSLRLKMVELGRQRLMNYSWEKSATEHITFYKKVMEQNT